MTDVPTELQLTQIRLLAEDENSTEFSEEQLAALWDRAQGSVDGTVFLLWSLRAGRLIKKVDVSTGSNRIAFSQQYDHALKQAEHYLELSGGSEVFGGGEVMTSVALANTDAWDDSSTEFTYWKGMPRSWFEWPPT